MAADILIDRFRVVGNLFSPYRCRRDDEVGVVQILVFGLRFPRL